MCKKCDDLRAAGIEPDNSPLTLEELAKARNLMALNLVKIKQAVNESYQFGRSMAEGLDPDPLRRQQWARFVEAVEQIDANNKGALIALQPMRFETITVEV